MHQERSLRLATGFASEQGRRPENQDFVSLDATESIGVHGFMAAIADGVSHGNAGRQAAELSIRMLFEAQAALPATAGAQRNAARAFRAINTWLHTQSQTDPSFRHAATTLTAVVMQGRCVYWTHVGDSRAYHLSGDVLTCLTEDHTSRQPEQQHVLLRALGMERDVRSDHGLQTLRLHDRLLLCTDGVHGWIKEAQLRQLLLQRGSPQQDAERLVAAALAAGSSDNASCIIIDILELPERTAPELQSQLASLPIGDIPQPGEVFDDFEITTVLSKGRYSRLLRARDARSDQDVVLKFPNPEIANTDTLRLAFVREAWIGSRLQNRWTGEHIELAADRQTRLYSVAPFYQGETLEQRLNREPSIKFTEGIELAQQLLRAVTGLHRIGVIHRDIKPENILILVDGSLRLIDLGTARLPQWEESITTDIPGTPSFMAPEMFAGQAGNEASDQFAVAVTLYRMWTRRYPYGEVEAFSKPRFHLPVPLARYRPDLPAWLGHALDRALASDPKLRFGDLLELSLAIEVGLQRGEPQVRLKQSLYERNPLRFWKAVSTALFLALLICLGILARS